MTKRKAMYIHKEGRTIILLSTLLCILITVLIFLFVKAAFFVQLLFSLPFFLFLLCILSFFRIPKRQFVKAPLQLFAPADGKVVVIERVYEKDFLQAECMQVSIFMSPANVHVNKYPVSGKVIQFKHQQGKYIIASHPKASEENERTSVLLQTDGGQKILLRQIAGALARRIVCYSKENCYVQQHEELGFIKFGSRVDLFIPLSSTILVQLGQKVKHGLSVIAELSPLEEA